MFDDEVIAANHMPSLRDSRYIGPRFLGLKPKAIACRRSATHVIFPPSRLYMSSRVIPAQAGNHALVIRPHYRWIPAFPAGGDFPVCAGMTVDFDDDG